MSVWVSVFEECALRDFVFVCVGGCARVCVCVCVCLEWVCTPNVCVVYTSCLYVCGGRGVCVVC